MDPPVTFPGSYQPEAFLEFSDLSANEIAPSLKAERKLARRPIADSSNSGLKPDRRNLAVRIRKVDIQCKPGIHGQWLVQKNAGPCVTNIPEPAASNRPFSPPSRRQDADWAINFVLKAHASAGRPHQTGKRVRYVHMY